MIFPSYILHRCATGEFGAGGFLALSETESQVCIAAVLFDMLFYWWIHTLERACSVYLLEEFASKLSAEQLVL